MIHRYPYTDFNEYNLDWVIERVKQLTADWLETAEEWNDTKEDWDTLYNYVHDYFDNLDVSQEVGQIIDDYRRDGTLATICQPIVDHWVEDNVPSQIDSWLNSHVTQETGYVLDSSLTLSNAAAPAKTVGDALTDVNNALDEITEETINLFDVYRLPLANNISRNKTILTGTASAFNSGYNTNGISSNISFEESTQYTISFEAKNTGSSTTGNGLAFIVTYSDSTVGYIACSNAESVFTKHIGVTANGKTVSKIGIGYFSEGANTWEIKNIQIEKGTTAKDYVNHLSAVDIYARKDLSENDYDIEALLNGSYEAEVTANGSFGADGTLSTNVPNRIRTNMIQVKKGQTLVIKNGSFQHACGIWNGTPSVATNVRNDNSFSTSDEIIEFDYDAFCVVVFRNSENGSISPSDFDGEISKVIKSTYTHKFAKMYFLEAFGTGDSTIIKFYDGTTLVIDFGLYEQQETLQNNWSRAISELGITHIDYGIISHYHGDHIGMLLSDDIGNLIDSNTTFFTAEPYTAEELEGLAWMDSMSGDHVVQNYTDVTQVLTTLGVKRVYPTENQKFIIGDCELQFWNCDHSEWLEMFIDHTMYDYNHCSLCNYITIGSQRICFSGDIGGLVMDKYKKTVLQSQILKVNHHCIGYDVVPLFINSVIPEMCITMIGYNLSTTLNTSPMQLWCEENFVPNVVTGTNQHNVKLFVDDGGYKFINSNRKLICADESITS